MLKILMIGPQASGKGTQSQILSTKFDLPIFSTGNILRQKASEEDELGKELSGIMKSGKLVSDDLVNKIIKEKIERDGKSGYILDGYPRNKSQVNFLDSIDELTHVFEIKVSDEESIHRVSGRRTCPKCQRVYHVDTNPPIKDGKCDDCGEYLYVREDEREDVLRDRLAIYHRETEPIISHYHAKNICHEIDGEQSIADVSRDLLQVLEK